jgi:hypothetical protein
MEAYKLFGLPILDILTECATDDLDSFETETIEIFNSVDKGFNTLKTADSIPRSTGECNPRAIFTNKKIEEVFHLLVDSPELMFSQVSGITGVPSNNIRKIACGENHSWLRSKYPEKYVQLIELKGTRRHHSRLRSIPHVPLISPDNKIYHVLNVKQFCLEHKLDASHLGCVLNGKEKQYKGWKVHNEQ